MDKMFPFKTAPRHDVIDVSFTSSSPERSPSPLSLPFRCFAMSDADVKKLIDDALAQHRIVVFSKSYCPFCRKAKQALLQIVDQAKLYVLEVRTRPCPSSLYHLCAIARSKIAQIWMTSKMNWRVVQERVRFLVSSSMARSSEAAMRQLLWRRVVSYRRCWRRKALSKRRLYDLTRKQRCQQGSYHVLGR